MPALKIAPTAEPDFSQELLHDIHRAAGRILHACSAGRAVGRRYGAAETALIEAAECIIAACGPDATGDLRVSGDAKVDVSPWQLTLINGDSA